jgi:hypothetical protein
LRGELGERRRLSADDHLAFHTVTEVEREVVALRRDHRERGRRRLLDRELDAGRGADANVRALLLLAHARERRGQRDERREQTAKRDPVVACRQHARTHREARLLEHRRLVVVLALVVGGIVDGFPEREAERD